jgi:uncharacterized membrane protein YcjF (UPF0283 family)
VLINVHDRENTEKVRADASADSTSKNRGILKQCFFMLVNILKALGLVLRYIDWLKQNHLVHRYYLQAFVF